MIECVDLGLINYNKAWEIQETLRGERERGEIPDRVLLLEHPPIFTLGKRVCEGDILSTKELIAADGIDVIKTNRGGRATYHGPGQLVGYFICSVSEMARRSSPSPLWGEGQGEGDRGVKRFVFLIEELLIRVLADFGIQSNRDPVHPGVWVGRDKIAAIGLHVSRGITQHGFALNVSCDLSHYRHIVPCGIKNRGVTSIKQLLGKAPPIDEVKGRISNIFINQHIIHS